MKGISLLFMLTCTIVCKSQTKFKELRIGDIVPNIALTFLNEKNATVNLSAYKGKLLIIDFWSIYCSPCIRALPELAKIQREGQEHVSIITIEGGSPKDRVLDFIKKQENRRTKIELPVSHILDKRFDPLYELFPVLNYGFPVEVWIDEKGILIGITSQSFVTTENIKKVILGDRSVLVQKHYQKEFDSEKAFLVNNNGGPDTSFMYRSMITRFVDSIPNSKSVSIQTTSRFKRLFFANQTIAELIKLAIYHKPDDLYNKQLELRVNDSSRYIRPTNYHDLQKHLIKNAYCYELFLPADKTMDDAFQFMLSDLERFFRVQIKVETKEINSLVLEKMTVDALRSVKQVSDYKEIDMLDSTELFVTHNSFALLTSFLNKRDYPVIIDKTGIEYPVDIQLKVAKNYKFDDLKKALNKVGIKVTNRISPQPIIVISDLK